MEETQTELRNDRAARVFLLLPFSGEFLPQAFRYVPSGDANVRRDEEARTDRRDRLVVVPKADDRKRYRREQFDLAIYGPQHG